ncbi:hypothetical protein AMJ49_00560 [Parcubacteria bacterium DG_74_2]|nr:MAG: hypothetical protein AMJ49_00560 [Parcubacteria bacterium DG_74_2]
MIEEYNFGSIKIDGKNYGYDIEVRWTGEVLKWQRLESHVFEIPDVKRAVEQNPDTIIFGTGAYGVAKITENCQNFIREKGIKLIIDKTEEAVKTFNIILKESKEQEGEQEKVIGLFHLTC